MFSCLSSSLSSLLSGRSERPMAPFLSLLCLFFQFSVPFFHHPVKKFLSRSSSASFSSSLPSIISLCSESPRNKCPIQIFCLVFTVSTRDLFSSTRFSTSSFVTCLRPAMKGKKSGQQQPSNSTELSHETRLKQAIKVRKSAIGQSDSKGVPLKL